MENNYFIYSETKTKIELERLHICTWEFKNNSAIIEFGGEIINPSEKNLEAIHLFFYIPWIAKSDAVTDLYDKLKESENCKFIFNDAVLGNKFLDDGQMKDGVIQEFSGRKSLCILPIKSSIDENNHIIKIEMNLKYLNAIDYPQDNNLYFRFYIEPDINFLSTRKAGISRSTIIYDIKINEKRNLPYNSNLEIKKENLCKINNCFCLSIVPNSFDLTFFDASTLKNVRTLEFDSFKKYLGDKRVKEDEYVVVFNKKTKKDSYVFFSVYSKERIGAGQFALAVLANLICGILLFIPVFRRDKNMNLFSTDLWCNLPLEVYLSIVIGLFVIIYFTWPKIINFLRNIKNKKNEK